MAIRSMTQGFGAIIRRLIASRPWSACLVAGGIVLILISAASADYAAGLAAFNRKDFAHAFSEWIESAKAGDAHAQHGLGMLYELGEGVPHTDPKAAADWYQKAAAQNYAPALNNLARLYADGRGVAQDLPKAIELWSRAADAGNTTARFNLGLQYANGSGVPKDMKKAASYLLQAAESGLPEAQFAVAGFYRDGTGVERDVAAARQWYDRAAKAGFEPARKELAALDQAQESPSTEPAAGDAQTAPAPAEQQQAQKTESPPSQAEGTETKAPEKPAEEQPAEATPAEPPPAGSTAEQSAQPAASSSPEPAAKTPEPAAKTPEPQPAEAQVSPEPAAQASDAEPPANEGTEAKSEPDAASGLPLAESLTGDERVYRIWLYTSGQEGDARSYWEKLNQQYPGLLKKLQLDLRRYFLGEAKGSLYRVFAGPFDSLAAAQKACKDIKMRFDDQFCRPVIN
jgi:TPR repeat protein